ncbi:MAG: hypothetical protein HOP19_13055 [Acidobacteria bacterium]|nr:hypothetical protein [Acidobacteriota bacterium]
MKSDELENNDWREEIKSRFPDWQTDVAIERWPAIRKSLSIGQPVSGEVIARAPFGVWVDINVGQPALLIVVNMKDAGMRRIAFDDYPPKGAVVLARINALGEQGEIGLTQLVPAK